MANPYSATVFPKVLGNYSWSADVVSAVDAILPPETPPEVREKYIELLAPNDLNNWPAQLRAVVAHLIEKGLLERFKTELFNLSQSKPILRRILAGQMIVDDEGVAEPGAVQSLNNKIQPFVNSKSFFEGLEAARYQVCAIWVDSPVRPADILGSGFLIASDLVLTAYHVVDDLLDVVPLGQPPRAQTGSEQRLAFLFDYWAPIAQFDVKAPPPGVKVVRPAKDWLTWARPQHPADGLTHDFGPPSVKTYLDCAVIRLAEHVGAASVGVGGGRMRGWQVLNGTVRMPPKDSALAILQYPSGGPQMFDKGDFVDHDPSPARLFYKTNASGGSSGSPCFDANPSLVGFHNAGKPTKYAGPTKDCNQGVLINPVVDELKATCPGLLAKSGAPPKNDSIWSLSDDPSNPEPILGRTDFKDAVYALFDPRAPQRVVVVSESSAAAAVGKSGKSFSTRILRAIARRRPATVVEFAAEKIQGLKPEAFLEELGNQIGLTSMPGMPEKPRDDRQETRWTANDLPQWFGQLIENRAKERGLAVTEAVANPAEGAALGQELVARELIWISIDDIHKFPPKGQLKELIAGMIGATDTQHVIGPGLKALRWLMIGHVPDFVREHAIQYRHDEVSQDRMDVEAWTACIRSAFISAGEESRYPNHEAVARGMYLFTQDKWPDLADPVLRLKAMANGVLVAIGIIRGGR